MMTGTPRTNFSFWLLTATVFLSLYASPGFAAAPAKNAAYISGANNADYRSVSTLNDFTRMVYRDRWQNINAADVLKQLAEFKTPMNSPAMRDIWRDVLLGDFKGMKFRNGEEQAALMAERLRLLNRLGFFDEAVRLYQKAAEKKPVPAIIAAQGIEALALAGSADGACLEVYMASKYLGGDGWTQDASLCAAYFGDKALSADLYDRVAAKAGAGFRTTYKMLNKESAKAIHVGIPPLWRTLLLAQGATVTTDALSKADAMTLAALANNPHVPQSTRLSAALRAADRGTVGFERLRKLYELKRPSETGMGDIIATAKAGGALPAADYYAAARFTFEGNERGTIVRNAFRRIEPVTNIKSQVYGWIVDKMTLQVNKLGWFAPEGFANMVTTNRIASAQMYYDAGNLQNSPFAIIHALLEGKPWMPGQIRAWEDGMNARFKGKAPEKINTMMQVAHAYDQEENKLGLQKQKESISNNIASLQNAIRNGGRGLTLVTSLNLLSEKAKLADLSTEQFVEIVRNMCHEGLFGERKKISLEFLIQSVL